MTRDEILKLEGLELNAEISRRLFNWTESEILLVRRRGGWSDYLNGAMEVLMWLRKRFFSTRIIMWDHTDRCAVVCEPRHGHGERIESLEVTAETLQLAICRAALLAVESGEE